MAVTQFKFQQKDQIEAFFIIYVGDTVYAILVTKSQKEYYGFGDDTENCISRHYGRSNSCYEDRWGHN